MKQTVHADARHTQKASATSARPRPAFEAGGRLAQLAAMVNSSSRVQASAQLREEIQHSRSLQVLTDVADQIDQGGPAQSLRSPASVPDHPSGEAPLQLKLPSISEFVHSISQEKSQKAKLDQTMGFLAEYLAEKEKDRPNIQVMFEHIDELDKSINKWFDAYKAPDMKNVPNGPYLLHLHEEVAKEHEALVEIAYKNPDKVIPVNMATLTHEEQAAVHKIWKSIVSESGNILVVGTSDFQKKMYADLAKLLQGSYGRAMIEYLDGGEVNVANRTTIGSNFDSTFARHGKEDEEPGSYAFPRSSLKDDEDTSSDVTVEKVDKKYPVAATRDDINRLMMEGKPGVNYQGVSYTFGKGSGSLVKIVEDSGESLVDKQLNQILTPSYLTLGHELGHAVRNRGGASFRHAGTETFDTLRMEEEGETSAQAGDLWTSSEEIINVTSSENKLRQEHFLTERHYHATQKVASATKFQQALNVLLNKVPEPKYVSGSNAWQTQIAPVINDPAWTPEKLATRLKLLPAIERNVLPVARKKYAIEKQLTNLQVENESLISKEDFRNIKDVKEVLLNLRTENWDEAGCQQKVDSVRKMMNDKAWWRTVEIGGALFATLAAVGVAVYLKYFSK